MLGLPLFLLFGALIVAVLLRAGVSLADRLAGDAPPASHDQIEVEEWAEHPTTESDPDNPYRAPTVTSIVTTANRSSLTYGRAYVIALAQTAAAYFILAASNVLMFLSGGGITWLFIPFAGLVLLAMTSARILSSMLPTTFRRGLLITAFEFLVGLLMLSPLALLIA